MKKIIRTVSKISVASASNIITGIVRTKIFAIILGTFGVGVISQLSNFSGLVLFISTIGIPIGVTKFVSQWEKEGKWNEINEIVFKSTLILVILGLVFLILSVVFSKQISYIILDSDTYAIPVILIACSFPLSLVITILDALVRGLKNFNLYVKISIICSILGLAIGLIFVIFYNILGFSLSILSYPIFSLIIYFYFFKKEKVIDFKKLLIFDFKFSDALKSILKLGFASLVLGLLDQLTILLIRSMIVKNIGIESNGIYQCVTGISNNYFSLFYMSLGAYILPILSEMNDNNEMNREINDTYKLTLLGIVPIIAGTFILRKFIIVILYSTKFNPASDLMIFNFAGDYFKALSWILGAWLIPRSKFKLWLIIGISYYVNFAGAYLVLSLYTNDLKNVVIAYLYASIFHFFVNFYYIRKLNKFEFRTDSFKLMITSTVFLSLILVSSEYNEIWGYYIILPLIALWLKFSVKKEDFLKLFDMVKVKLIKT